MSENTKEPFVEKFSYSKLSTFDKCPLSFKFRYEDGYYSNRGSLATEIGTIAHKCMELIALDLIEGRAPDYEHVIKVFYDGCDEFQNSVKDQYTTHLPGVNELKLKYAFDWLDPDKFGKTYEDKIQVFLTHMREMEQDTEWRPVAVELPFDFDYEYNGNTYRLHGFIDRVDRNEMGAYRVVDYKTSKKVFDDKDVKTSMQMFIYDRAILNKFGTVPVEHLFDFVFLGEKQYACSKGYEKRGTAKLNKWFGSIEGCRETGEYVPKPTPLCHWCDFCKTNADAEEEMKTLCRYHSLWLPNAKTFAVAEKYDPDKAKEEANQNNDDFWF